MKLSTILSAAAVSLAASSVLAAGGQGNATFDPEAYSGEAVTTPQPPKGAKCANPETHQLTYVEGRKGFYCVPKPSQ